MTKQYRMPIVDYTPEQMGERVARFEQLKAPPNETFICLEGQWKVIWRRNAEHSVLLNKYDVCAIPPYVPRRFECVQPAPGQQEGLLQSIQPRDTPEVEWV